MRAIVKTILMQASLLLAMHTAAHAGPLLVVSNGMLMGAQGIDINGRQYDVSFSDTRPLALAFTTYGDSYAASDALDRLVFQGTYDTAPGMTNGCANPLNCFIVTAFDIGWPSIAGTAFSNTATRYVDPIVPFAVLGNSANSATTTFAHWTVHQERQVVPEPSSLLLAGIGLVALLGGRRRATSAVA